VTFWHKCVPITHKYATFWHKCVPFTHTYVTPAHICGEFSLTAALFLFFKLAPVKPEPKPKSTVKYVFDDQKSF